MRFFIFILCAVLIYSCEKPLQEVKKKISKSEFNIKQKHIEVIGIDKKTSKRIDDWQEYRSLNEFLELYKSISPNEALNNSRELEELVKIVKDSAQPKFLEVASFQARINHLHNETLRLNDMSFISSIGSEEVNNQVTKIIEAFSGMNSKINTLVQQEELDKEIDDPKFNQLFTRDSSANKQPKLNFTPINIIPKKNETNRERKMRLSKEDRLKKRSLRLQEVQKKQDKKIDTDNKKLVKKKKNQKIQQIQQIPKTKKNEKKNK